MASSIRCVPLAALLSVLVFGTASAQFAVLPEQKVLIGVGGGAASGVFTLRGEVYVFPSSLVGLLGGVSYSRSTSESVTLNLFQDVFPPDSVAWRAIETNTKTTSTILTADAIIGLRRSVLGRGFVFLGAGITYQDIDVSQQSNRSGWVPDYEPAWGSVLAASVAIPFGDRLSGFFSLRQRYLSDESSRSLTVKSNPMDPESPDQTFTSTYKGGGGGLEMTVGIGFGF